MSSTEHVEDIEDIEDIEDNEDYVKCVVCAKTKYIDVIYGKCDQCNIAYCQNCIEEGKESSLIFCSGCDTSICETCNDKVYFIGNCSTCSVSLCANHHIYSCDCCNDSWDCQECYFDNMRNVYYCQDCSSKIGKPDEEKEKLREELKIAKTYIYSLHLNPYLIPVLTNIILQYLLNNV